MRYSRPKKTCKPSMDVMERRQLLSAAPLGAISWRDLHGLATEVDRAQRGPIQAQGSVARPRAPLGHGHLRSSRPGSGVGAGSIEQQADIANAILRIADPVLQDLAKSRPGADAAVTQVRQSLAQIVATSRAQPSAVVSAASDDVLDTLLDTFGPGDPFASLGVVSADALKPGDIIVRCTPGLTSQGIELAHWSRYSHVALYIGDGQIIDAVGAGVHTRSLADLLSESNRVGVLRVPDLSAAQARTAIRAAQAQEGDAYNFVGLAALEAQKLSAVIAHLSEGLPGVVGVLSRAERLPSSIIDNGTFACSQLVRYAFIKAGVTLSQANGLAPGDVVRLGMVGVLDEVGRLEIPAQTTTTAGAWLP
ncbi:YiiX/YebB-like N1pC/P60 family cysteine hydrolase [Paludisphaera mucosa]|uniref:YiiX/YebB-like N1pC/P60 family cysteine hydrolase n=1 Tax=Paludisphaera mucosa TaxID=3030827 RepID=A0ABT6FIQ9_9BACT|nr:YiiX/YebB-like N1pC/P60 family cysteine hydrolase [Paludisphaera mucosa]MDG3007473.1 YiiX/YebB-like N1pC/P60 family cysteine hydrolase [Paludisphaera mucosa]